MSVSEGSTRLAVNGEVFEVTARRGHPGEYDYVWISGPNPGYGFSSSASDGAALTMADHMEAIQEFLSQVDPEIGHID